MTRPRTLARIARQEARSGRPLVCPKHVSEIEERDFKSAYLLELWRIRTAPLRRTT